MLFVFSNCCEEIAKSCEILIYKNNSFLHCVFHCWPLLWFPIQNCRMLCWTTLKPGCWTSIQALADLFFIMIDTTASSLCTSSWCHELNYIPRCEFCTVVFPRTWNQTKTSPTPQNAGMKQKTNNTMEKHTSQRPSLFCNSEHQTSWKYMFGLQDACLDLVQSVENMKTVTKNKFRMEGPTAQGWQRICMFTSRRTVPCGIFLWRCACVLDVHDLRHQTIPASGTSLVLKQRRTNHWTTALERTRQEHCWGLELSKPLGDTGLSMLIRANFAPKPHTAFRWLNWPKEKKKQDKPTNRMQSRTRKQTPKLSAVARSGCSFSAAGSGHYVA